MKLIRQRFDDDCAIAAIAMALDLEYDSIRLQRAPSDGQILLYLLSYKIAGVIIPFICKDPADKVTDLSVPIMKLITDHRCLLTVVNRRGRHLVAWDGRFVYDPSKRGPQLLSAYSVSDAILLFKI